MQPLTKGIVSGGKEHRKGERRKAHAWLVWDEEWNQYYVVAWEGRDPKTIRPDRRTKDRRQG